jgi:hypothetical protein
MNKTNPGAAGTELQKLFHAYGVPDCQDCRQLAEKMNAWGSDECSQRLPEIVELIFPRAKTWVQNRRQFVAWMFPKTTDAEIRRRLRALITEAIERAES